MPKPLELALLGIGGTSLFAVCFVGFASVAGVPMHSLPVVGALYETPEPLEEEPVEAPVDPTRAEELAPKPDFGPSDRAVLQDAIASLGGWALPPPFEMEELGRLTAELRQGREDNERREQLLDSRELQLEDEYDRLQKRSIEFDEMRQDLEAREAQLARDRSEIEQLATELERPDLVRDENADRELLLKAQMFKDGDADTAAERLTAYPAAEAAQILHKLENDTRAIEILNALPKEQWKEYVDAYSATNG